MAEGSAFHRFVDGTTDVFVLFREILIVMLFCLVLFLPGTFKSLLGRVGISKVTTPFGDIDVQTAGSAVAGLNSGLSDSVARLQEIQGSTTDPNKKRDLEDLAQYMQGLQQKAQTADENIKSSLVAQQSAAEQASPQSAQPFGWLFLGHVDQSKQHWSGEGGKNVPPDLSPVLTVGEHFAVTKATYLHDNAPSGGHFGGKVIGVVPAGGQVEVLAAPEYSSAIAGGYFLWVNVKRVQ